MSGDHLWSRIRVALCLIGVVCGASAAGAAGKLAFSAGPEGAYTFDTGLLRGTLCAGGKSSGLKSVVHVPSGTRLDGGAGIFGYYRLLTTNNRYGKMAWDWPGQSRLLPDGAVEVTLPAQEGRPFEMIAVYRWSGPATLDLETTVKAGTDLGKFEVFLASYFHKSLPSPYVRSGEGFLLAEKSHGDWLMFPRDKAVVSMVRDGRWEKEPHPVAWTIMPEFKLPMAFRRGDAAAPMAVVMAPRDDCFAVAMPYQGESHYSLYLSLFGRDMKAGEKAKARTRLVVTPPASDEQLLALYKQYVQGLGASKSP